MQRHFLFAMTGAQGLCGGIASTNLNVLHTLIDLAYDQELNLTVLSYLEHDNDRPNFLPPWVTFEGFQGNKWSFVQRLLRASLHRPIVCFDHVTLALPLLPFAAAGLLRTIIFTHGSEAWKRVRWTSRWSLRYATLCLANSPFTLKKMQEHLTTFRGMACPLGLPPTFERHDEQRHVTSLPMMLEAANGQRYRLGSRYLLVVARMDSREGGKGHRALIRLLPELRRNISGLQVVCVGPGDDRDRLRGFAHRYSVASAVFFPGYIPTEMLKALYQQCYALVLPSTQEGFGLVYLEAMQYAKPCVGCWNQGAEDVIVHGETGFLVHDPNDPQELLDALRELLQHPQQAQWFGENGYKRLRDAFTAYQYQARLKSHLLGIL